MRQATAWYILEVWLTIFKQFSCFLRLCKKIKKCFTLNLLTIRKISFLHRFNASQWLNQLIAYLFIFFIRDGNAFSFLILNYHISVSIRTSVKRGHCTRAEQECCIMTARNNRKLPKHKLSQNAKYLQCLLEFGLIEDNVTGFQWPWNSESG